MTSYKASLLTLACASLLGGVQCYAADGAYGDSPPTKTNYGKERFGYISYAPSPDDGKIEGYEFDSTGYFGLGGGIVSKKPMGLGVYGEIKGPVHTTEDGVSEISYSYTMVNLGVAVHLADRVILMGGLGYSWEDAEFVLYGDRYQSVEDNSGLNFNAGALIKITNSLGAVLAYDTAASAYSVGLAFTF